MSDASVLRQQLVQLAAGDPEVQVLWLYGSRAKGHATEHSDWDLAVAFYPVKLPDLLDNGCDPSCWRWRGNANWGCRKENCRWWTSIRRPSRWRSP